MSAWRSPETFEGWRSFGGRNQSLLRRLLFDLFALVVGPLHNNFIIIIVEQCTLVVQRTRVDLHLDGMLLGSLLDLFQMLIVAILGKPADDVAL